MSGESAYREALARHAVQDVRPLYRELLARLKSSDPETYEKAVARYEDGVVRRLARGEGDPLALWVDYGMWLAERARPGRAVEVDESGRARPVRGAPPPGRLLLHLPDEPRIPAVALAIPAEPSPPQRATIELLCPPRRRGAA